MLLPATLNGRRQHGIDMSLRDRRTVRTASLAFGVHCSVFKKRVPDVTRQTEAGRTDVGGTRTRSSRPRTARPESRVLVSTSRRSGSANAQTGMRGDWQDYR